MQTGEIELLLLDQLVDTAENVFVSAEMFESVYGTTLYDVKLQTQKSEFWNKVIEDGGLSPVEMRFGRNKDDNQIVWADWKTLRLKKMILQNQAQGLHINLILSDSMFELKNIASRKSFKEKTASEIIEELCNDARLKVEIEGLSDQKFSLHQCGMNNYDFIKNIIIPRARKQEVLFYTKNGNQLVLKSRKKEKAGLEFKYKAKLTENSINISSFTSVMLIDESNFGTQVVTFDSLKSQASPFVREYLANDSSNLPLDAFSSPPPNPLTFGKYPSKVQNIVIETLNTKIDDVMKARVDWHYPLTMFRVAIPSYLLPQAEVGVTATLDSKTSANSEFAPNCGGSYFVYATYHRIFSEGDVGSVTFLERRVKAETRK